MLSHDERAWGREYETEGAKRRIEAEKEEKRKNKRGRKNSIFKKRQGGEESEHDAIMDIKDL